MEIFLLYLIYSSLTVLTLLFIANMHLFSRDTMNTFDKISSVFIFIIIGNLFYFFGWKHGLGSLIVVMASVKMSGFLITKLLMNIETHKKADKAFSDTPRVHKALEKLIMSMADASKDHTNKHLVEHELWLTTLMMLADKVIDGTETDQEFTSTLVHQIEKFERAFPNWPDAYIFGYCFINDNPKILTNLNSKIKKGTKEN